MKRKSARIVQAIPVNEQWLHEKCLNTRIKESLEWANVRKSKETKNPAAFLEELKNGRAR